MKQKKILNQNRITIVFLVTIGSICLSVLINFIVSHLTGYKSGVVGYSISIGAPLLIAPVMTWFLVGLLLKINMLRRELELANTELKYNNEMLGQALLEVKTLQGIIPICSSCKKIRNDRGMYEAIESYISRHTDIDFSHTICPDCIKKLYPEIHDNVLNAKLTKKSTN